ncbi:hypothetical protein FDP41_003344 [Naegleria fowleri]|uniref:Citrate synthase n=1 Tax=Naegleria fowleri TaxID=5763 RepID=A0A6A5BRN4_NAEFO|nr:uncharacterized protein FDP41_003344 [Naegleria fowleri]KAF0977352.1 hypothetical protein FDP41_003344 [Naegleria fowleri]
MSELISSSSSKASSFRRMMNIKQHLIPSDALNHHGISIENHQTAATTNPTTASVSSSIGSSFQQQQTSTTPEKRYLEVKDSKTGKVIKINVEEGDAIKSVAFESLNLVCLDPGFLNTAIARSSISYIDGEKGILRYRGYDIEELAEKSSFLEVAFLLINGELPDRNQLSLWEDRVTKHSYLHENMVTLLKQFRYDAHPMGMVISSIAALGTFYEDANPALKGADLYLKGEGKEPIRVDQLRFKQIYRLLGKLPTIAACAYRHRIGKPYNNPVNNLNYTGNFLYMLDRLSETNYHPNPVLARALEKLWIIHAEHEMNCSTAAMRHLSSSRVDPYTAIAGAGGALYGPLHGGACEAVLHMLDEIGSKENIPKFIEDVKNRKKKLMGFGHRIYRSYDPRAKIVKQVADEVFEILGKEPMIEIAIELERIALNDPYFKERKLYPNVDFYSGLVYKALGFPTDYYPVLFLIPRVAGWLAHWIESLEDPDVKIFRPKQVYTGIEHRKYIPVNHRKPAQTKNATALKSFISPMSKRRSNE